MVSIGQRLRATREAQNREIAQVAGELRISARYLEAIESEKIDELPGGFFSRAFVKQYARHLGIEESEIREDVDRLFGEQTTPPVPGEESRKEGSDLPPLPQYGKKRRPNRTLFSGLAALVVVVVICAVVYQYWLAGQQERASAVLVEEPPTSPVFAAEAPRKPPEPLETVEETDAEPEPVPSGPLYLQIEADEEVWVEITSAGEKLFSGLLQSGETRELTGLREASLLIGNAGGLRIYSNGKSVGKIGPRGHVRVVRLTPGSAEITNPRATHPTPDDGSEPATTEG